MKLYEGKKPFIFVSYSHEEEDKKIVIPIINELIKNKYRVWYDDGIHLSEDWPEVVASHLEDSSLVVFMVSKNFVGSVNCKREVYFAADEKKDIFLVHLDDTKLSSGLRLQTSGSNNMLYHKTGLDQFVAKMFEDDYLASLNLKMDDNEFLELTSKEVIENSFIPNMSIAIGIVKYQNKVLMLKRKVEENGLVWGFPAILIKPSDEIKERIIKGVRGETNIETRFIRFLGKRVHPNTRTITYYCQLEYIKGELTNLDPDENLDARWIDVTNYKDYITSHIFESVEEYLDNQQHEVVVSIVKKNNQVLIVHRKKEVDDLGWVFPGGTVEENENIYQASIRELEEETNVKGEVIKVIADRIHPHSHRHIVYIALKCLDDSSISNSDSDLDDARWVDIKDIDNYFSYPMYPLVEKYLLEEDE